MKWRRYWQLSCPIRGVSKIYKKDRQFKSNEACKESHWEMGVSSDLSEALQIPQKWRETKHLWDKETHSHLKSGFKIIFATEKKKRHRGGSTNKPAQVTALDPWQDHLSASWGQPDIVHWASHCPAPWCHHCQGRPGVYSGTRSVLRSIWPRRAHTVSVSCQGFLWVS